MSQVPTFLSEDEWMPLSLKPLRSPKQWQGQLKGVCTLLMIYLLTSKNTVGEFSIYGRYKRANEKSFSESRVNCFSMVCWSPRSSCQLTLIDPFVWVWGESLQWPWEQPTIFLQAISFSSQGLVKQLEFRGFTKTEDNDFLETLCYYLWDIIRNCANIVFLVD